MIYLIRLTFCISAQKSKILHIPKRQVFCNKTIIERSEKNVSTPIVLHKLMLGFCTGGFRNGNRFGQFCPKYTLFRHSRGRNVFPILLLRSTHNSKTNCLVGYSDIGCFGVSFCVTVHCSSDKKSSVIFFPREMKSAVENN